MTGRQKILAVDDSLLICQQIEKVLKNEEYTVYKSHSAKETLELLDVLRRRGAAPWRRG